METLGALTHAQGSDLVLGANDGISYDPAWNLDYWKRSPHHTIVWVEPNPTLFNRLSSNTAEIEQKVLLNLAVRPESLSADTFTLYCWNTTMVTEVAAGRMESPLPAEAGLVLEYWNALCSISKSDLIAASNIPHRFNENSVPKDKRPAMVDAIFRDHGVQHTVPALSTKEIIVKAGVTDLNYLQIDVEGLDNDIVRSLPIGDEIGGSVFAPKLILYENKQARYSGSWTFLEERDYYVCCCFNHNGNNIVAVYNGTDGNSGRRKSSP